MVGVSNRVPTELQLSNQRTKTNIGYMERCQSYNGRVTLLKRKLPPKKMVTARTRSSHKFTGTSGCQGEFGIGQTWRLCPSTSGQQGSLLLYKEAGRNKEYSSVSRGLSDLERLYFKGINSTNSSLAINDRKCKSRLPEQTKPTSVGVSVIKRNFQFGFGSFSCQPNSGCVRVQGKSSVDKIHVLVSRSSSSSTRCIDTTVGSGLLSVSSRSLDTKVSSKNNEGEVRSSNDCSSLAHSNMVVTDTRDVSGSSFTSSKLQDNSDQGNRCRLALPEPSCGSSPPSLEPSSSKVHDLQSFLSNHLSDGTKSGYKCSYNKFVSYCHSLNANPITCEPTIIAQYLKQLYDDGCSYSSVNFARSAISKYHNGYNGVSAGSHKLVTIACKAVFRLRPPLPKYKTTFDITVVLDYIKTLPRNPELSLKLLSFKALFLLTVCSLSRVSSVSRLGPELLANKVRNCHFR